MAQALIVIDIQEGLVKENPFDTKNFIINTKAIIQHFRDQSIEVIFIRHSEDEGLLATGSDNWQVYHELKPQKNEKIFNKYYNSIFKDTDLKEYLDSKSITDLTFVGMQVEFCIDTSVKVGFEYGYKISLKISKSRGEQSRTCRGYSRRYGARKCAGRGAKEVRRFC